MQAIDYGITLSQMNFTVIPFLLGSIKTVENVKEWNFGPEYKFELKRSVRIYMHKDIYIGGKVTAVVKCRQKVPSQRVQNVLFCRARNITVLNITYRNYDSWKKIIDNPNIPHQKSNEIADQLFTIEFSKKGVKNYKLKAKQKEQQYSDIITDIIDQLNIGTDLTAARNSMKKYENRIEHRSYTIYTFKQYKENTTKATNCDTSGSIEYTPSDRYDKDKKFPVPKNKRRFGFRLKLLPIYYKYPAYRTFIIKRNRKACTHQSQYLRVFNEIWTIQNVTEYFNEMNINDRKPKFSSHTRYDGNAYFPNSKYTYHFWQDVYLDLVSIQPARKKFNIIEYK